MRIGEQVWLAENLRYATATGSWCWENREEECARRGRYYAWGAAMEAAPPGWHLPSDEEWKALERTLGLSGEETEARGFERGVEGTTAGARLKMQGAWPREHEGRSVPATNETGFSALPVGWFAQGRFFHEGYTAWWTRTGAEGKAWLRGLGFFHSGITRELNDKAFAFSVRLVRDSL